MVTTRWIDCQVRTLDEVIQTLINAPIEEDVSESATTTYSEWEISKEFEENPTITLNSREIRYNFIRYSYNQISPGMQPIADRTVKKDGFIIVYATNGTINYIINRNTDAMKLLRKMLNYSGKNEIVKNAFSVESDFFVWMIRKVYSGENIIATESEGLEDLSIDTIKAFKGDTEDLLNKVSAKGESVINIISTLSFLLESKNLNQITVDIQYGEHGNIELALNNKDILSTNMDEYQGIFEKESYHARLAKIYLLIYIEIIPILVQQYKSEMEDGLWNSKINIEFLKTVAKDLLTKVENRIEVLEADV